MGESKKQFRKFSKQNLINKILFFIYQDILNLFQEIYLDFEILNGWDEDKNPIGIPTTKLDWIFD